MSGHTVGLNNDWTWRKQPTKKREMESEREILKFNTPMTFFWWPCFRPHDLQARPLTKRTCFVRENGTCVYRPAKHINVATMMLYVNTTTFKFIAHMCRGEQTNCLQANHSHAGSIASKFLQGVVQETLSNAFTFRTVVCSTVHVAAVCF